MKTADLIDLALKAYHRKEGAVITRSGRWHPTGSRRQKALARRSRHMEPLLEAMIAPLFEYHDTFLPGSDS